MTVKTEPIKSIEEVQAVEKYLWLHNKRNHLIWLISVNTGLLLSEILNLNIGNVKNFNMLEYPDNSGMVKRVRLNNKVAKYLSMYLRRMGTQRINTPLFRGQKGRRLDRSQVQRFLKEAVKTVGIRSNVSISTMRRTFGRFHYLKYHDIVLLKHIFNQDTVAKTLKYIGLESNTYDISYADFEL